MGSKKRCNKIEREELKTQNIDLTSYTKPIKKMDKIYLDKAPKSLPLTMLIIRNFEENKEKVDKHIKVRYKVELTTNMKSTLKLKESIEKEKQLFSRIEKIYNFCDVYKEETNEKYDYNLVDTFIPFPNMKRFSNNLEPYKMITFNTTAEKEGKKNVSFNISRIVKNNWGKNTHKNKFTPYNNNSIRAVKELEKRNVYTFGKKSNLLSKRDTYNKVCKGGGGSIKLPTKMIVFSKKGGKNTAFSPLSRKNTLKHNFNRDMLLLNRRE
ncbi:conserved Plasmodium protein, unknown function, partial [Plasmodium malariae]